MTKYISFEGGDVQSVTDEHYELYLTAHSSSGKSYPKLGFAEHTEAEARELNPRLFGAPDERIVYTDDELIRAAQRQETLAKLRAAARKAGGA